jgi:hypothetical protein
MSEKLADVEVVPCCKCGKPTYDRKKHIYSILPRRYICAQCLKVWRSRRPVLSRLCDALLLVYSALAFLALGFVLFFALLVVPELLDRRSPTLGVIWSILVVLGVVSLFLLKKRRLKRSGDEKRVQSDELKGS